jgi:hypothetical protein
MPMSDTAEATLAAVIAGYAEKNADAVLGQFHDDVRVVGSKGHENWSSKTECEQALRDELGDDETIGGELTDLTEQDLAERIKPDTYDELGWGWVTEVGELVFGEQTFNGRWSCVVQRFGQADWRVVHSHFSVPETIGS